MIRLDVAGIEDLEAALKAVGKKAAREAALVAVQQAAEPMVAAAKRYARNSRDTGALEESITFRAKPYRRGDRALAVIGPASKFRGADGRQPSKYAHLVEFGHTATNGKHVAAKPFMRPAVAVAADKSFRKLGETFGTALKIKTDALAEVKKARAAKRKKGK